LGCRVGCGLKKRNYTYKKKAKITAGAMAALVITGWLCRAGHRISVGAIKMKEAANCGGLLGFDCTVTEIAVKVAAIVGLDNLKAFGNAIHMCVPSVLLRKPGCAGFSAVGTPQIFNPTVEDDSEV
jgi:hypothetical protein